MIETKYDKRQVDPINPPEGYTDYINSLPCCACGSTDPCDCTIEDFKK